MIECGDDLEWIMKFNATVYSDDRLHRHKFQKPFVLKQEKNSISLKNDTDGKIKGIMTFYVPCNTSLVKDIEDVADNLLRNFQQSLLLRGYLIDVTKEEINGTNAGPDRRFQVESSRTIAWRQEGSTRMIDDSSINQIKSYFNMMFSDSHLQKIAARIESKNELPQQILNFIVNWIEFNKIYNLGNQRDSEQKKIAKFVQNLSQRTIILLHNRNLKCIRNYQAQGNSILQFVSLQNSIEGKAVCSSLLEIYQIRNAVFHEGSFQKNDLDIINNFVFDVVNNDTLDRLGDPNLAQFYDV